MVARYRVVIIGAGIGGLAAAIALRRIGCEVVVYEQATSLRLGGAGLSLWPNALEALRRLGLEQEALRRGERAGRPRIMDARGATLVELPHELAMLGILRSELIRLLAEQLHERELRFGQRCVGVEMRGFQRVAIFADGSEAAGDLIVGADGIHSFLRSEVLKHGRVRASGYVTWRGLSHRAALTVAASDAGEVWGRRFRFGYLPVSAQQVYWFVTSRANELLSGRGEKPYDWLQRELTDDPCSASAADMVAATIPGTLRYDALQELMLLRRWHDGAVVLLGDAAHAATPNLGQGACMALEDAVVLAECVQAGEDVKSALAAYERRRRMRVWRIVTASRWLGRWSQPDSPWLAGLRDGILRLTPGWLASYVLDRMLRYPD